jgi:hypothetical protein
MNRIFRLLLISSVFIFLFDVFSGRAMYKVAWTFEPSLEQIDPWMEQLAKGGFNIAQTYTWADKPEEWRQTLSKAAQQYNIGIVPWGLFEPEKRAELIPRYAQDPAIAGWLLYDEPGIGLGNVSVEQQIVSYQEIKGYDPYHPLWTVFGQSRWPENFSPEAFDVFLYDMYPYGVPSIEDPAQFIRNTVSKLYQPTIQRGIEAGKTFIPLIQAFPGETGLPNIQEQYDVYKRLFGKLAGVGYYKSALFLETPEIYSQIAALNQLLGGGGPVPYIPTPPTPPVDQVPIDPNTGRTTFHVPCSIEEENAALEKWRAAGSPGGVWNDEMLEKFWVGTEVTLPLQG